jgi:hypothetical protein
MTAKIIPFPIRRPPCDGPWADDPWAESWVDPWEPPNRPKKPHVDAAAIQRRLDTWGLGDIYDPDRTA